MDHIVSIHMDCFPESQSTNFGAKFLKAYYLGHVNSTNSVCFVYENDWVITGFIIGGVNMRVLSRQVVFNTKSRFIYSIFYNILKNPKISIRKFWEYTKSYILPKSQEKTFYNDNTAGLESIAVMPKYRGQGIAEKLVKSFLQELKVRRISACRLGVEADNIPARKFYEKMNFEQVNEEGTSYIYFFDDKFRKKYCNIP